MSVPTNVTGWSELYDGNVAKAAFVMYDTALGGWTIGILFLVFQIMLAMKSRNPAANFITSLIFIGLYMSSELLKTQANAITLLIVILELAGIFYILIFK